jgi:hypothetical protein
MSVQRMISRRDDARRELRFSLRKLIRGATVMDVQGNLAGEFECTM